MAPITLDMSRLAARPKEALACSALQALKSGSRLNPLVITDSPGRLYDSSSTPHEHVSIVSTIEQKPTICPSCGDAVDPGKTCQDDYCTMTPPPPTPPYCREHGDDLTNGVCLFCVGPLLSQEPSPSVEEEDTDSEAFSHSSQEDLEHTCQKGNFDCLPCQNMLSEVYDTRKISTKDLMEIYEDQSDDDKENIPPPTARGSAALRAEYTAHMNAHGFDLSPTSLRAIPKTTVLPAAEALRQEYLLSFQARARERQVLRELTPPSRWSISSSDAETEVDTVPVTPESLEYPPSSPTDSLILRQVLPSCSPESPVSPAWLSQQAQSPTRKLWMSSTTLSALPQSSVPKSLRASVSLEHGSPLVNHAGSVDFSCSRTLNLGLTGQLKSLKYLSHCLVESATSDMSAIWMEDIISIVSSTSSESGNSKIHIASASVIVGPDHLQPVNLLLAYSALAKLMQTYSEFRRHRSTVGTTSRSMEILSFPISSDQLSGDLTRLETTITKEAEHLQQKKSFLQTLRLILRETQSYLAERSGKLQRSSTGKTNFPRSAKTTSHSDLPSTGIVIPEHVSGSSPTSPTPSPSFRRRRGREPTRQNSERPMKRRSP